MDRMVSSSDCIRCFRESTAPSEPSGPLSILPMLLSRCCCTSPPRRTTSQKRLKIQRAVGAVDRGIAKGTSRDEIFRSVCPLGQISPRGIPGHVLLVASLWVQRTTTAPMRSAPEARTGVRRSLRLATAAAAAAAATTSLVATTTTPKAAEAFLCGPPPRTAAAGSSRRLLHRAQQQQQQQPRSSSWCAPPTSSSGFGTSAASSGQECTGRRRRRLPPSSGGSSPRPRAVAPLSAAAAGSDRPSDAAAAAGGGRVPQQSRLPQRVELAAGQPRGSVQQPKEGGGGGGGRKPFGPSRHITDETLDLIRASTSITEVIGQ